MKLIIDFAHLMPELKLSISETLMEANLLKPLEK